ncbi:MAG: hypothetical protein H0U76_07255 [Ktedonobacteraceae bacterium]|nr:hypothetical protein [Ktedonobacteraceae bacterium]
MHNHWEQTPPRHFRKSSALIAVPILLWLLCAQLVIGATYNSNGSNSDVQSKINSASDGDTVTIPSGTFTWTSGVTIGIGVKLQGQGSGRVIGRSASSITVGNGTKTFVTQSSLAITTGETLKIERTGTTVSGGVGTGTRAWMQGTVTSYSGTTLVMNVTSTSGSGTHPLWIISTLPTTTVTHGAAASTLITLTEDTSDSEEVSGIFFQNGSGTGDFIGMVRGNTTAKPILIHDCYFQSSSATGDCIQANTNRGVIWNCSFSALPFSMAQLAIHHVDCPTDSWTTLANWGAADNDGTHELFVEDSDFHAWLNATDFDSNARTVMRHCLFNLAGIGTHGADTGDYGQRYFEVYDSEFAYNGFSNGQTLPNNQWFFVRGGTFIVTDCVIPEMTSTDYPNKPTWNITVMNLQRKAGPNPCWGAGISGIQYPCPRQAGMGRVTGKAGNDSVTYIGDSEPIYFWNNTGTGAHKISFSDYGGTDCSNTDSTTSYVVTGRDYFDNTSKPGYTKYVYPHPLRGGGDAPSPPQDVRVVQ